MGVGGSAGCPLNNSAPNKWLFVLSLWRLRPSRIPTLNPILDLCKACFEKGSGGDGNEEMKLEGEGSPLFIPGQTQKPRTNKLVNRKPFAEIHSSFWKFTFEKYTLEIRIWKPLGYIFQKKSDMSQCVCSLYSFRSCHFLKTNTCIWSIGLREILSRSGGSKMVDQY